MRAKRNPQYDEMFLGGLVDRAKGFAEKRPGMAKAIGLGGGMLLNKAIGNKGAGLFSKMSGAGLMGMLGQKLRERRNSEEVPQAEYGAMVKKYRTGGMIYAEDSNLLSEPKGPESLEDLFSTLEAVEVPEDYTEQEIIDVRGGAKFGGNEAFKKRYGYALDEDENVAQPMEFRVITERGKRPGESHLGSGRGFVDFDIENVELGGVDEETGATIPNRITIPAEIYDMLEEGEISMRDLTGAMSPYYSRSQQAGVRTRPSIVRGAEPEEEGRTTPPRPRGGKKRQLPQIRFPQIGYKTSPKYAGGPRPIFKKGQLGRIGRGG
jgi:hypothetical protein